MTETLPAFPAPGHTRYRAVARHSGQNIFTEHGIIESSKTVDLPSDTPFDQVQAWAAQEAQASGLELLRVELVTS